MSKNGFFMIWIGFQSNIELSTKPVRYYYRKAPNKACTGRLGLCAFFGVVLNFGSFPVSRVDSTPAAGNAGRWALEGK